MIGQDYIADAGDPRGKWIRAWTDISGGVRLWPLWSMLGWIDIRQRYRRAMIGPFWITISMGVMVLGLGGVYGALFKQDMSQFLPYVAGGFIAWFYISGCISDGSTAFITSESMIKLGGMPICIHVFRAVWRNLIIMLHNVVVMLPLYALAGHVPVLSILMLPVGILLVTINLAWLALALGAVCTRYRDLPPIVANAMQLLFFVTPIVFRESALEKFRWVIEWNPLYYMVDAIRGPLVGTGLSASSVAALIVSAVVGCSVVFALYARVRGRIAFWV